MSKRQLQLIIGIIIVGLAASAAYYKLGFENDCSAQHLGLISDMQKYDSSKDAQLCDALNSKITKYNDMCKSNIEELDCG